jgi:recombination protein RecA
MAKKKTTETTPEVELTKKQRLELFVKEQQLMAEKEKSVIKIGKIKDFKITGREHYMLTGICGIDFNTGGFKKGTYNVIYGAESGGKSTIALQACEGFQLSNPDLQILYVDAEQTVDETFISRFPNLNKDNITFLKEGITEKIFDILVEMCQQNLVDVIIVDSIEAMTTNAELGKSLEENVMMDKARLLSRALAKMNQYLSDYGITVIMIQQERIEMSMFQAKTHGRSGGKAMRYYPATVYRIAKVGSQNETTKTEFQDSKVVSQYVKIINEKSKISEPYKETYTFINTDVNKKVAVEKMKEFINYAVQYGLIIKTGGWYQIIGSDGEPIEKVQGEAKVPAVFIENLDLYTETKLTLYSLALPPELFIAQFENIKTMLKQENVNIKKSKIQQLEFIGHPERITEKDRKEMIFEDRKVEDFFSNEDYKKALFNLEEERRNAEQIIKDNEELADSEIEETKEDIFN